MSGKNINSFDENNKITRPHDALVKEWNDYFREGKKDWNCLEETGPKEFEVSENIVVDIVNALKRERKFFRKVPENCSFCEELEVLEFSEEDSFWENCGTFDETNLNLLLVQFIADVFDGQESKSILNDLMQYLNSALTTFEKKSYDKLKCSIIILYNVFFELNENFQYSFAKSKLVYYQEHFTRKVLQSISKNPPKSMPCKWNPETKEFQKGSGSQKFKFNFSKLHILYHLLGLCLSGLRFFGYEEISEDETLRDQVRGVVSLNSDLVVNLYSLIKEENEYFSIAKSLLAKAEELEYVYIKAFPNLFYLKVNSLAENLAILPEYTEMVGWLSDEVSLLGHVASLYLYLTKDTSKKIINKFFESAFETFMKATYLLLDCMGDKAENILKNKYKFQEARIDQRISFFISKITVVKVVHYLLLSYVTCFQSLPEVFAKLSIKFYLNTLSKVVRIVKFCESEFKYQTNTETSFNFPERVTNSDIKFVPTISSYFVVDGEIEDEDVVFEKFFGTVVTWLWCITQLEKVSQHFIGNSDLNYLIELGYTYNYWSTPCYMAQCGLVYNFSVFYPVSMIRCIPVVTDLVVKYITEMNIPIEGYILLFQVIRTVYPQIVENSTKQKFQQLLAPLRTILSSEFPMLKYYNHPLSSKDEQDNSYSFPVYLLANLEEVTLEGEHQAYAGQFALQRETKAVMKLLTPFSEEEFQIAGKKGFSGDPDDLTKKINEAFNEVILEKFNRNINFSS